MDISLGAVLTDVVRVAFAGIYMLAGLVLASMVIRSHRFKLGIELFDMFTATFVGLFCFSASALMLMVM